MIQSIIKKFLSLLLIGLIIFTIFIVSTGGISHASSDARNETISNIDNPLVFPGMNSYGISLRDYFAIMALNGRLSRYNHDVKYDVNKAYEFADAMLLKRVENK